MTKIRTRFAPSPTGRMHVGNLRTALYAYLIAKHDKQHLDVYYWNNYDMYKCLANLSLNDKKTFIKEAFACDGRKETMKMRSLKAITPDAEAVKLRSLSRLCSY